MNRHAVAAADVGAVVAVANRTKDITLVDLKSGSTSHILRGHSAEVLSCSWAHHKPNVLATGAADSKVILWDVRQARSYIDYLDYNNVRYKSGKDLQLAGSSHQGSVQGVTFTPCGRFILSLGSDRRLRKWDTMSLKNLKTKFPDLKSKISSSGRSNSMDLACTVGADREVLFVPELNKTLMLDIASGSRVGELVGHHSRVLAVCCNSAALCAFTGGQDRFILQWDARPPIPRGEDTDGGKTGTINQYTVDTWSSSEEENS